MSAASVQPAAGGSQMNVSDLLSKLVAAGVINTKSEKRDEKPEKQDGVKVEKVDTSKSTSPPPPDVRLVFLCLCTVVVFLMFGRGDEKA